MNTENSSQFTFVTRPTKIPGDMRPEWRISLLSLIILKTGRANVVSLEKLHLLNWAIRSPSNRYAFLRLIEGQGNVDDATVRFEPALNRAIQFALGEKLIAPEALRTGKLNLRLTVSGLQLAKNIEIMDDCFVLEKSFLNQIRGQITENKVDEILRWGMNQ